MNELTTTQAHETMRRLTTNGIAQAETDLLSMEQVPCPVNHFFGPGLYIREVHLSAGTLAIGHRQTQEHVNIMLKGRVLMLNDDGTTTELSAPIMFMGKPGRKMGYILEDVVWRNIYPTDERDVQVLERTYLDKSPSWDEASKARLLVQYEEHGADRKDFQLMLLESGFSAQTVQHQSENLEDQCPLPQGTWKVKTGPSPIQGTGIFLTSDADQGETLGPARLSGMRTPLGRYTNHSPTPNAMMVLHETGDISLVTTQPVKGCMGGHDGDEVTIDYRQALRLSGVNCATIGEN